MRLIGLVEGVADAFGQFMCRQHAVWFDDSSFAMHPHRLNRIEPGTLDRQGADDNPHTVSALFDELIVRVEPRPHRLTEMPRGIVPDQHQDFFAGRLQFVTTPAQVLDGQGTVGVALSEPQPQLFVPRPVLKGRPDQQAITSEALGSGSAGSGVFSTNFNAWSFSTQVCRCG